MTQPQPKKSDLGVRVLSAIVMVTVAGAALWLGGSVWAAFVATVALGVLWEWWGLVAKFANTGLAKTLWVFAGLIYVGGSAASLVIIRQQPFGGLFWTFGLLTCVIATDVGAYFSGRLIGGPKIAPKISPSKTWAGLVGGMIGATMPLLAAFIWAGGGKITWTSVWMPVFLGCLLAVIAQAGDFFESWMKRRAGVKDSGSLIPGHGGLFDRVDGLIAVSFAICLLVAGSMALLALDSSPYPRARTVIVTLP